MSDERRGVRLILLGPPGSGKGSQSSKILKEYGGCYLATGDILREAVRAGTELGKKAKAIMDRGEKLLSSLILSHTLSCPSAHIFSHLLIHTLLLLLLLLLLLFLTFILLTTIFII
jgi:adenylate kinase